MNELQNNKRLLIVSNNCLSLSNANGRTLQKMLLGYDREKLAQFYISGNPDTDVCAHYYHVTDEDALNFFLHGKRRSFSETLDNSDEICNSKIKKSCKNCVLRSFVWMRFKWWSKSFTCFLHDFSPEAVLLQAGDAPFMYEIAMRIAEIFNIPLIMFNTESYVLKKRLYSNVKNFSVWHIILKRWLYSKYSLFMKKVDYCIYNSPKLECDYQKVFPHPQKSTCIYVPSDLKAMASNNQGDCFSISYIGNLGVGRCEPIIEVAKILYKINPNAKLKIYGNFVSEEDKSSVCACPAVEYHGIIPYEQVPNAIKNSTMILHCENRERLKNLKYAFSTKIADSLACGIPFFVYADKRYPFVEYLNDYQAAHIADSLLELENKLLLCMTDKVYLNQFLCNAQKLAKKNHSAKDNSYKLAKIIDTCCNGKKGPQ